MSAWSPEREVPTHLARAAILGAGRPAWPAALEVLASWSGVTVETSRGRFTVDATASGRHAGWPDDAIIGELGGVPIRVDADGGVWLADAYIGEGTEAMRRLAAGGPDARRA